MSRMHTEEIMVQGGETPVPASVSELAGSQASSASYCGTTGVERLAPAVLIAPSDQHWKAWSKEFERLEKQINSMIEFITPKNNIHATIKTDMSAMKLTFMRLKKLEAGLEKSVKPAESGSETQTSETQTSPLFVRNMRPTQQSDTPKRKEVSPTLAYAQRLKRGKRQDGGETSKDTPQKNGQRDPSWQQVETKRTKKKKKVEDRTSEGRQRHPTPQVRTRRTRSSALILKLKDGKSFADVLTKVKKDPALREVGQGVAGVRRTLAGDILLVLDKASQDKAEEFSATIGSVLGDEATTSASVQTVMVEIVHMDGTTSKEEVYEAVAKDLGEEFRPEAIVSIRDTYGGTRTALLKVTPHAAKKLLEKKTVRINWSSCRVREVMKPTKCFRCWQFGHIAKRCSSAIDRSKLCIRCGIDGHKADKCSAQTCCILCKESGGEKTSHMPGSSKCPVYVKAYQALLQKRR